MHQLPIRSLVLLLASAGAVHSAEIDFGQDVAPIFTQHCLECHGQETPEAGVGLATYHQSQKSGDSGEPLYVPGNPEASLLVRALRGDGVEQMPYGGEPLAEEKIKTIEAWIAQGGHWPDDGWRPEKHWAYIAPQLPPVPQVQRSDWPRNSIDSFILARQEAAGLGPNAEADKLALMRRLYLDLTGLPPTIAQRDAYLRDTSPGAYERMVDRLLSSSAFGPRWARHWLDLARYADSEGYQRDELREVWPYRDWVIDALNADMPFDQFSIEQLAGDLLPNATREQKIATGFHRNTLLNLEAGTDPQEDHFKQVVDRVNTTGTVWLGSTVGCMQCHNHKYDPFTTVEYYQLAAYFNNTPVETRQKGDTMGTAAMVYIGPTVTVPRDERTQAKRGELRREKDRCVERLEQHLAPKWASVAEDKKRLADFAAAVRKRLKKPAERRTLNDYSVVVEKVFPDDENARKLLKEANRLGKKVEALAPHSARVMQEREEPRETFVARRGDFLDRGQQVQPAVLSGLHPMPEDAPPNRLGLARWLISPQNPLVARVTVNRIWAEIFGKGIVPTLEDFGVAGDPPTHPELLDYLAVTFIERDQWSIKRLIRRIVTSATYRQSARVRPGKAERDPVNQWYWRHPGHRYDAETIRDNALAISGLLSRNIGGPPAKPFQPEGVWRKSAGRGPTKYVPSTGADGHRRGVYTIWRRSAHYPSFANFDAPDRGACVVRRSRSNTPLQALTLMNDPVFVEIARAFARRIENEGGDGVDQQIKWAFHAALTREPTADEHAALRSAYDRRLRETDQPSEAWLDVAMILLNTHEVISRG